MTKKDYIKPDMKIVQLHHVSPILAGSNEGVDDKLQNEEVDRAW
jgi:hypothetical protein